MRVIAGRAGGRRLAAPPGALTRPTADRVREALFSILGPPDDDARVLDLFAGAGALGIEALSRGAARAVFVDRSRSALRYLRRNLEELGMAGLSQVHQDHGPRFAARLADGGGP
ncbi:MAG TPA: RsmD family RNA methyltransferase, partial [Kofleriaceae bacterium]|nr:RsmD family RNA methyltransferase [Kofleriaceae bacterium]